MSLNRTRGPDEGSMTVVFACPDCGRETAMLTNAMETQVVRSLGVSIGGRDEARSPMETVRSQQRETSPGSPSRESNCPFTGTVEDAYAEQEPSSDDNDEFEVPPKEGGDSPPENASDGGPHWTEAAEERLERIPPMARTMARRGIEAYAREEGLATIDESVMDELKGQFRI